MAADFGLAKYCDQSLRSGRTSDGAGTLVYMAPELFKHGEFGASVDVWSLGVIVLELLSRKKPEAIGAAAEVTTSTPKL